MSDILYWNNFYKINHLNSCSDFCKFIIYYFNNDIKYILDAGCGNGRDSYELSKKYIVEGIDNCGFIPKETNNNITFKNENFITINKDKYNLIYSRFTFHSINNEMHKIFLDSITKKDTYLAIEARSIKGIDIKLYHGKTHYRNYICLNYLKDLLIENNFEILYIAEGNKMAVYKTEDPICIRVIAKKL